MQRIKTVLSVAAIALCVWACNNVDFKKTKSGVPYKLFSNGKGDTIGQNYVVKLEVVQKTKDTVLFSSYTVGEPQYLQVQSMPGMPVSYNDIRANLVEVLAGARKGDSIYMVQATDSLLAQNPQLAQQMPFKKGDQIITTVRILDFYKTSEEAGAARTKDRLAGAGKREAEAMERFKKDTAAQRQMAADNQVIEAYLQQQRIQASKTPWGVYVQTTAPGQGARPQPGQYAKVQYKGTTLEGQQFDAGIYPLQIGLGGSILGFEEGVKQFAKGGRGRIFIPSPLGYGVMGNPPTIQPNQVLVFDIEMLDITDTPPVQGPPAAGDTSHAGHGHQ